jgi:hypothetical protein
VGHEQGYVTRDEVSRFAQAVGFTPAQAEFALRAGVRGRLLQASPRSHEETAVRYRITTIGAYTYKKLMGTFVYMDAVVVDTPIVDEAVAAKIDDCTDITDRVSRSRVFAAYLDAVWDEQFSGADLAFSWPEVKRPLEVDYARIDRTLAKSRLF